MSLLPIQSQFLHDEPRDRHHYNQAVLLDVPATFEHGMLLAVVAAIYRRHDALRLRFREGDGGCWQSEHEPFSDAMLAASCIAEPMPEHRADFGEFVTERCNHWQASFDLEHGPLLRAVHFRGKGTARLLLVAHHVVIDGVSWRIILVDLERAYRQLERGEAVALAP
jgi:NRPS condensation-like uncharacterized protein